MMKLRNFLKKAGKDESGFTLIELMVVVVILGILGSIVIPRIMTDVTGDAEKAAKDANFKMLQSALDRYYVETGNNIESLSNSQLKSALEGTDDGKGPWIDEVPKGYKTDDKGKVVEDTTSSSTSTT